MKLRALDMWVWTLMGGVLLPALVALAALPFAQAGARWAIPLLGVTGFVAGGMAVLLAPSRAWWQIPLKLVPFIVGLPLGTALLLTALAHRGDVLEVLLLAFTMLLAASIPWLVYRARQPFFALVPVWVTVAGAWKSQPNGVLWRFGVVAVQSTWWVSWLLVISLLLIGLATLRDATARWQRLKLAQIGPVFWPTARSILLISLVVSFIGLIPFTAQQLSVLAQFWKHTPLSQGGPLAYDSASGHPQIDLGAALPLDAVAPGTHTPILTYSLLNGNVQQTMVLGATLDSFDGQTWQQSPVQLAPISHLSSPSGATTIQARITVQAMPRTAGGILLGFADPIGFDGIDAQPALAAGDAPSSLAVAYWQTDASLTHATYITTAAVLPPDSPPVGSLPADVQARLTAVPAAEAATIQAQSQEWVGSATTPAARAQALIQAFHQHMTLDESAQPAGDPVLWCLHHQRGGTLLLNTTYILLARSLGIPMRLAEGYEAGNNYDEQHRTFTVYADDATVWTQMAIPGRGWSDLYPAANVLTVYVPQHRAGGPTVQLQPTPQPTPAATPPPAGTTAKLHAATTPLTRWIALSLVILGLFVVVILVLLWRWDRVGRHLTPLVRFFVRLGVLARMAGVPLRASDTATQATAKVTQYTPPHRKALHSLNDLYEQQIYGVPGQPVGLSKLRETWQQVSRTFWRRVALRPLRIGGRKKRGPTP